MKIVFFCHRVPFPPDKGERTRAFHQIRWLAKGHDVHVLTLAEGAAEAERAAELSTHCASVEVFARGRHASRARAALAAVTGRPLTPAYFFSRRLARRAREIARSAPPGMVVACSSSTAQYARVFGRTPKILDLVDVDSAKWEYLASDAALPRRAIYGLEARRLRRYERRQVAAFDRVALTTEHEVAKLARFSPTDNVFVLPMSVDVEALGAIERREAPVPTLVFTGQMDYPPNVAAVTGFVRRVFPALRRRRPTLEFKIVGRQPTREVRALTAVAGVEVTGEVPAIAPYLAEAWLFVAPLVETVGVPSKIIEAMAASLPTVATRAAASGLDPEAQPGRDLLVAHDDDELTEAIDRALAQRHLRERLGASGRRIACRCYAWQRSGERLEEVVLEIGPRPRAREPVEPAREIGVA